MFRTVCVLVGIPTGQKETNYSITVHVYGRGEPLNIHLFLKNGSGLNSIQMKYPTHQAVTRCSQNGLL